MESVRPPIRAIVSRFSFPYSHRAMEQVLRERPFALCGIISMGAEPQYFEAIDRESQEWFCSATIRSCKYHNIDWNKLAPLDEDLIEKMRGCEAQFMDTVTRLEWKRSVPYMVRKRWYLKHLRFWNDYLLSRRINLFLSAWIPHEIPDLIIYHLCKLRGIPVLYFHASTERDISFAEYDWEESATRIDPRYEGLLAEYAAAEKPEDVPLSEESSERYRALTASVGQKPALQSVKLPTYWSDVRRLLWDQPLGFLRCGLSYLSPHGLMRAAGAWQRWRVIRRRNAFYDAHAIEPDLSKSYVYLALHFQPEASTNPMSGAYVDQVLIARLLNAFLPDDVLIYVKDHPRESGWLSRSIEYYKDFLELKKVRLIARHVDTFLLREHCRAVATGTGSVGFEALFRGKPVLLFGHRFYQHARGVFRIRTAKDCKDAVRAIFEKHVSPTLKESRLYLKAMEETCLHGVLNHWDRQTSRLSDEELARAGSSAILEELEKLSDAIAGVSGGPRVDSAPAVLPQAECLLPA